MFNVFFRADYEFCTYLTLGRIFDAETRVGSKVNIFRKCSDPLVQHVSPATMGLFYLRRYLLFIIVNFLLTL